jgi:hypothetical protein
MKMDELRKAFAKSGKIADKVSAKLGDGLPDCWLEYVGKLADTVLLLTDPTPITEEGLRELGFEQMDRNKPVWVLGDIHAGCENGLCAICGPNVTRRWPNQWARCDCCC